MVKSTKKAGKRGEDQLQDERRDGVALLCKPEQGSDDCEEVMEPRAARPSKIGEGAAAVLLCEREDESKLSLRSAKPCWVRASTTPVLIERDAAAGTPS